MAFGQCDSVEQYNALMTIYNDANGDNWRHNTNWGSNKPFEQWYGISTNEMGCVTKISLWYNSLSGKLSKSIGEFSELETLSIGLNPNLKKELPKEIGKLTKLKYMYLSRCAFSGVFPKEIGNLKHLIELIAHHNHFSQNLPSEFGNLEELQLLDLEFNEISGIPESFSNLQQLKKINFSNNRLEGNVLEILSNLINLETIYLNINQISGSIPDQLANLPNLLTIRLESNKLSGCIGDSLLSKFCDGNSHIYLGGNYLLPHYGNIESICFYKDQIGAPCNDWDKFTKDDRIRENCECKGDIDTSDCKIMNYLALMKIYDTLNGDNWKNNDHWGGSYHSLNDWHGIRTNSKGCVTEIYLRNNNLTGEIPQEIGQLSELKKLNLALNNLTGKIPKEIGQLSELKELNLAINNIAGEIPKEIGQLANLRKLQTGTNQLTGTIPKELGMLSELIQLDFSNNKLSGPIPKEVSNMYELETFNISHNHFSGPFPTELTLISNLKTLNISNNNFSGQIPKELAQLTNLRTLNIKNNKFSGSILNEIGNLKYLESIDLSHNQLTGNIPASLTKLRADLLALNDNLLSGNIPVGFGSYFDFHRLYFQNNNLSGCFPPNLKKFQCEFGFNPDNNTYGYNFTNNPLLPYEGDFEKICEGLPQKSAPCDDGDPNTNGDLIDKDCNCTPSSGCQSRDLVALMQLYTFTDGENWKNNKNWGSSEYIGSWHGVSTNTEGCVVRLELTNNRLKGEIPDALGDLSDLKGLILAENKLMGKIPKSLKKLKNLKYLNFSNNLLVSNIPIEISNIISLKGLNLSQNELSGMIPKELANSSNLNSIILFDNKLVGKIPREIYQLNQLNELSIQNNQISGHIPKEIGQLSNLIWLNLSNNQLDGNIPSELESCTRLEDIRLSNNNLTGNIPEEIGNIENINWLYLDNNNFYDCIPNNIIQGKCENNHQFKLGNNPLLPHQGDLSKLCNDVAQIGAPCDDGDPATPNDKIDENCLCNGKTVAIKDIKNKTNVRIYPNPASDVLHFEIENKSWHGNTNIVFYNLLGEEVRKLVISDTSDFLDYRIDIPSGVYFCRVGMQIFKVVISR